MDDIIEHQSDQKEQSDFWHELPDYVKQAIENAKKEMDAGLGIPHAKVMAEVRTRFLKR